MPRRGVWETAAARAIGANKCKILYQMRLRVAFTGFNMNRPAGPPCDYQARSSAWKTGPSVQQSRYRQPSLWDPSLTRTTQDWHVPIPHAIMRSRLSWQGISCLCACSPIARSIGSGPHAYTASRSPGFVIAPNTAVKPSSALPRMPHEPSSVVMTTGTSPNSAAPATGTAPSPSAKPPPLNVIGKRQRDRAPATAIARSPAPRKARASHMTGGKPTPPPTMMLRSIDGRMANGLPKGPMMLTSASG